MISNDTLEALKRYQTRQAHGESFVMPVKFALPLRLLRLIVPAGTFVFTWLQGEGTSLNGTELTVFSLQFWYELKMSIMSLVTTADAAFCAPTESTGTDRTLSPLELCLCL